MGFLDWMQARDEIANLVDRLTLESERDRRLQNWERSADLALMDPEKYTGPGTEGEDRFQDLDGSEPLGRSHDITTTDSEGDEGSYEGRTTDGFHTEADGDDDADSAESIGSTVGKILGKGLGGLAGGELAGPAGAAVGSTLGGVGGGVAGGELGSKVDALLAKGSDSDKQAEYGSRLKDLGESMASTIMDTSPTRPEDTMGRAAPRSASSVRISARRRAQEVGKLSDAR